MLHAKRASRWKFQMVPACTLRSSKKVETMHHQLRKDPSCANCLVARMSSGPVLMQERGDRQPTLFASGNMIFFQPTSALLYSARARRQPGKRHSHSPSSLSCHAAAPGIGARFGMTADPWDESRPRRLHVCPTGRPPPSPPRLPSSDRKIPPTSFSG